MANTTPQTHTPEYVNTVGYETPYLSHPAAFGEYTDQQQALSRYHQIKQQRPELEIGIYRQEFCPRDEGVLK